MAKDNSTMMMVVLSGGVCCVVVIIAAVVGYFWWTNEDKKKKEEEEKKKAEEAAAAAAPDAGTADAAAGTARAPAKTKGFVANFAEPRGEWRYACIVDSAKIDNVDRGNLLGFMNENSPEKWCTVTFNGKAQSLKGRIAKPAYDYKWVKNPNNDKDKIKFGVDLYNQNKNTILCRAKGPDNKWYPGKTLPGAKQCWIADPTRQKELQITDFEYAVYK